MIEPVVYGNVEITDNMKAALTLKPEFMMHDKMDMEVLETEIEKGLVKSRYAIMSRKDENNSDIEENTEENSFVVCL